MIKIEIYIAQQLTVKVKIWFLKDLFDRSSQLTAKTGIQLLFVIIIICNLSCNY